VERFVVISGCSGGGKSTLLQELRRRGYAVVEEPGWRIVQEELNGQGSASPWVDETAFASRAVAVALADRSLAGEGWVVFDRGLVDAAAALQHVTSAPVLTALAIPYRYHRRVFVAPPWPKIYVKDPERHHDLEEAVDEYSRLLGAYASLGYEVSILAKIGVERAEFILTTLLEL
jgi:predicted ATPase